MAIYLEPEDNAFKSLNSLGDARMNFSKLNNQPKIRLLLAEDHTILRQGLVKLLSQESDIEVVGEASNGEVAVQLAAQVNPDVILMDMGMPKMDGIEATRRIHAEFPEVCIIGLSMYGEMERANAMIAAGASLYLNKTDLAQDLIAAIRSCSKSQIA
jgi:DNA-binding NarL/FixJ family response regulator